MKHELKQGLRIINVLNVKATYPVAESVRQYDLTNNTLLKHTHIMYTRDTSMLLGCVHELQERRNDYACSAGTVSKCTRDN